MSLPISKQAPTPDYKRNGDFTTAIEYNARPNGRFCVEDKELYNFLGEVNDARSLLTFVAALEEDRRKAVLAEKNHPSSPYGPDAGDWENISIEDFLESARAWAEDTDFGLSQGLHEDNLWRRFADFLYAGKVYE